MSGRALALVLAALLGASGADPSQAEDALPACQVGMHVPRVSPLNYGATILAIDAAKGSAKVKSDADGLVDWVGPRALRTSCVLPQAAAIAAPFFVGKWSMFVGPTPHHAVIDGKGYLVVGPGAHVPPLTVNADGSYVWVLDSKTTLRGSWRPMAADEIRQNTQLPAILLLKGEGGANWQLWRRGVNPANNRDQVNIDRMDLGQSYIGTRLD